MKRLGSVSLSIAVGRRSWRHGDFDVALWTGLIGYTLLIVGRRTFLTANATAAIWPAAGIMAATFLLTAPRNWKWVFLIDGDRSRTSLANGALLGFNRRAPCSAFPRRCCWPS